MAAISAVESRDGRLRCLAGVLEKKRGENAVSRECRMPAAVRGAVADAGMSTFRGGEEAPVRAFFTGAEDMALSSFPGRAGLLLALPERNRGAAA